MEAHSVGFSKILMVIKPASEAPPDIAGQMPKVDREMDWVQLRVQYECGCEAQTNVLVPKRRSPSALGVVEMLRSLADMWMKNDEHAPKVQVASGLPLPRSH